MMPVVERIQLEYLNELTMLYFTKMKIYCHTLIQDAEEHVEPLKKLNVSSPRWITNLT